MIVVWFWWGGYMIVVIYLYYVDFFGRNWVFLLFGFDRFLDIESFVVVL